MSDKAVGRVPWSFWVIGAFALIWNALGVVNYLMQMNADTLAAMPSAQRAIVDSRPEWATGAFALAVFGGALAALLLLLRKAVASSVFIAALLGVVCGVTRYMMKQSCSMMSKANCPMADRSAGS